MAGRELYAFSDFTLDVSERRLSRGGQGIPLAPKTFDLLVALVRSAGRLVRKSDLLAQVWPDVVVEEGILAVHVSALRKALDEDGRRHIETVPRAGYRFAGEMTRREVEPEPGTGSWSVAVLPARPLTAEILSGRDWPTGLTFADALIDRLGRLPGVVVRPTRAIRGHTGSAEGLASVGEALRVDAVVESTFARTEGRVQATARLVRSRDGSCLWQGEFDEADGDLLAVATAVAASLARHLGLRPAEAARRRQPHPAEAYELFGRGRSHMLAASMFEVPKAVETFRAASELAPTYAAAHAGLALAHCAEAGYRVRPWGEAFADARAAALRALALDGACADAQVALGAVLFRGDWSWVAAERSLERALRLNPNHTEAYLEYGSLVEALGRLEEGLEMKQRALERDPFSPLVHLQVSMSHFYRRRYDESIEWARRALELDPRHPHAREHLAAAWLKKGDFDRYMEANLEHARLHNAPAELLARLKEAYAMGGPTGVVRFALDQAARQPQAFPDFQVALFQAEAGDLEAAFRHLDRAVEMRDPALVHLAVGPQWDRLRSDPSRFAARLERMGLSGAAPRLYAS
jgi:DNA-binding winged helix-turn-helix (wHTH) protein/tetratricopeptide (TPR) repeat protein